MSVSVVSNILINISQPAQSFFVSELSHKNQPWRQWEYMAGVYITAILANDKVPVEVKLFFLSGY